VTPLLPTQMSGLLFPTGCCPDIGSHTVHPASARCPEPCLFGGRDGGLWEWPDSSCHSLVGSFKIEFIFSRIAIHSQGAIGWHNFLLGQTARQFEAIQQEYITATRQWNSALSGPRISHWHYGNLVVQSGNIEMRHSMIAPE
jgi:hypothetical protein